VNELEIAKALRDGALPSPQRYKNLLLIALRITGTGAAYRNADGLDEYVWRDPTLYLNDEFLERCQGLPVVIEHPDGNVLDSVEFSDRIIGTVMIPYIKGEEVWGIAKILDAAAAGMLEQQQLSTSPGVLVGGKKYRADDGKPILIEGKPSLLDHLAITRLGVWDRGGAPAGVNNQEVTAMTDSSSKNGDDARGLTAIMDSFGSKIADALEGMGKKFDAMCGRMDAEAQARKDAEEKARNDANGALLPLAALPNAEREKYTAAQVRADRGFQAFGDSAPHALNGESLRAYRCRLAGALKRHSPMYKDSDLSAIADEAALTSVETQIFNDAVAASAAPPPAGAPLRQVTTSDEHGRRITKFYGDPAVAYAPFSFGGLIQRGRITPPNELRRH
jgi:hypothetical protein